MRPQPAANMGDRNLHTWVEDQLHSLMGDACSLAAAEHSSGLGFTDGCCLQAWQRACWSSTSCRWRESATPVHSWPASCRVRCLRLAAKSLQHLLRPAYATQQLSWAAVQGLPKSSATTSFAEDLFSRIPRSSGAQLGTYQQQERQAAAYAWQTSTYQMLSDDEEGSAEDVAQLAAPSTQPVASRAERQKQMRKVSACRVL